MSNGKAHQSHLPAPPGEPPLHEPSSDQKSLRVAETFDSVQGEGRLTGVASHFIRLSGCNLRCWFCDTPYASWKPEGPSQSIDQLVRRAIASGNRHIVLTGGEPLMFAGVERLVCQLRSAGLHVTIETAGTVAPDLLADLMSISPKLPSSTPTAANTAAVPQIRDWDKASLQRWSALHEQRRWQPDVIAKLIANSVDHQIKFVSDTPADQTEVSAAVDALQVDREQVWIMPQAITTVELDEKAKWLQPWCAAEGYQYCDRKQIRWYGNRRGT